MSLHYHVTMSWASIRNGSCGSSAPYTVETTSEVVQKMRTYMRLSTSHRNGEQFMFSATVCDGGLCRPQPLREPSIDSDT